MVSTQEIEVLVQARKTQQALRLMKSRGFFRKKDSDVLLMTSDWLRRLGLYSEAFHVLKLDESIWSAAKKDVRERKKLLAAARILNTLGASRYALAIAGQFTAHEITDTEDALLLGNIFLTNFDYGRAKAAFEIMLVRAKDPNDYRIRLNTIGLADAENGLGNSAAAIELAAPIARKSPESILKAIAWQAQGEYFATLKNWQEARRCLATAEPFFPQEESTVDRGIWEKWMGYVLAHSGDPKDAKKHFLNAEKILRNPALRPEALLHLFKLKHNAGLLSDSDLKLLQNYPGIPDLLKLGLKVHSKKNRGTEPRLTIALESDEFILSGQRHLGIPKEVRLVAFLTLAGKLGIPRYHLITLLWPDEVFSLLVHPARLEQLIRRCRSGYGVQIEVRDSRFFLKEASLKHAQVILGRRVPEFLAEKSRFSGKDLETYYDLSRSRSREILSLWLEKNWIRKEGAGSTTSYRSVIQETEPSS